jgi:uncharacterized Zn-binding protein involved in type VI secretion
MTAHGALAVPGTGSGNVRIGGLRAWRALQDQCVCPAPGPAHGSEMVMLGSTTVMINGRMAARRGDVLQGSGPPNSFVGGQLNVRIGDVGFGMAVSSRRTQFVESMQKLLGEWSSLSPDGRMVAMQIALAAVAPSSMPELSVDPEDLDADCYGHLDFRRWQVKVNKALVNGEMTEERMAVLSNTLYHEARHGEQWFNAAQSRAAAGDEAKKIAEDMHIPPDVAAAAVQDPAPRGTPAGEMGAAVNTSVYGSRSQQRNETLTNMDSEGNYDKYRALPEEEDAWRQGDAVEDEYVATSATSP